MIGTGNYTREEWKPQGCRVGWVEDEGEDLYLEPEASYALSQALAREMGDSLTVTTTTLRKRLSEKKLLKSVEKTRAMPTFREGICNCLPPMNPVIPALCNE